ncbi:MAG: hypothetical protein AAGA60_24190, partial [Cyanobacteria bacterium P01_E01_bin.42]
ANNWQRECVEILGSRVISVYLRGSIPRGLAIEGVSDLDGLAIVSSLDGLEQQQTALRELGRKLRSQYPVCTAIETQIVPEAELWDKQRSWGILLKTQGLPLWGVDHRPQLPPVTIGRNLIHHAWRLRQDIHNTRQWLRQPELSHKRAIPLIQHKCAWLCRSIVRSGFELVMEREQAYTRDLYLNYAVFARYFPAREREMRRALQLAISPSAQRSGLLVFWREFGHWLTEQIDRQLATQ